MEWLNQLQCKLIKPSVQNKVKQLHQDIPKKIWPPLYGRTDSITLFCRNLWSLHQRGSKFCWLLWKNIPTGPVSEVTLHRGGRNFLEWIPNISCLNKYKHFALVCDLKINNNSYWTNFHWFLSGFLPVFPTVISI